MMPAITHALGSSTKDSEFIERAETSAADSGFSALLVSPLTPDPRHPAAGHHPEQGEQSASGESIAEVSTSENPAEPSLAEGSSGDAGRVAAASDRGTKIAGSTLAQRGDLGGGAPIEDSRIDRPRFRLGPSDTFILAGSSVASGRSVVTGTFTESDPVRTANGTLNAASLKGSESEAAKVIDMGAKSTAQATSKLTAAVVSSTTELAKGELAISARLAREGGERGINNSSQVKDIRAHLSLSLPTNPRSTTADIPADPKGKLPRLGNTDAARLLRDGSATWTENRRIEPKNSRLNSMAVTAGFGVMPALESVAADSTGANARSAGVSLSQPATGASLTAATSGALASAAVTSAPSAGPHTSSGIASSTIQGPIFSVVAPVGTGDWSSQLGDRVLAALSADLGEAVINLAPEELGPVKVSLVVSEGEVRLQWMASVQETRHALEQALPRLREMLAQEGLQLTESQVSAGNSQQNSRDFMGESTQRRGDDPMVTEHESVGTPALTVKTDVIPTSLLDIYV